MREERGGGGEKNSYSTRLYIYTIFSPNLGFEIVISGREREQGRFRGSIEGVGKEHEGVGREYGGARESTKEHCGVVQRRSRWEAEMASSISA